MANTRELPRRAEFIGVAGYYVIKFNNKRYLAHRICYALLHNIELSSFSVIDHIDGDIKNNKACNLRAVSHRQNSNNKKLHRDGKPPGCYFHKNSKKWMARYKIGEKSFYIGSFKTQHEAADAYSKKMSEIGEKFK